MGRASTLSLAFMLLGILACRDQPQDPGLTVPQTPKVQVGITTITVRDIKNQAFFPAVSYYPENSQITAPIAGYLVKSPEIAGVKITLGALLFTIETKEHRAINANQDLKQSNYAESGLINVLAPIGGLLTTLDHRQGEFVSEGTPLASVAASAKLGFRLTVPFEFAKYVKIGGQCTILLPDDTPVQARISENLNTSPLSSQTLTYLVKPLQPVSLPEGLNVMVGMHTEEVRRATVLPKSSILSNETMEDFWIMKLINDSTAVKIPVSIGLSVGDSVQVTRPAFTQKDRILSSGNYGLEDTALVKITLGAQ